MPKLPSTPGPHKVDVGIYQRELFELEKAVMMTSEKLYQFKSIEEFVEVLTEDRSCQTYIWNSEAGELVGLFSHCPVPDQEKTDELLLIVVHPDFQEKGYGKKMMAFYLDTVKDATKWMLATHIDNAGAIKLYESFGYRIVKELPNVYGDGQTRVLLER